MRQLLRLRARLSVQCSNPASRGLGLISCHMSSFSEVALSFTISVNEIAAGGFYPFRPIVT